MEPERQMNPVQFVPPTLLEIKILILRYGVLTVVTMSNIVFQEVRPSSLVKFSDVLLCFLRLLFDLED